MAYRVLTRDEHFQRAGREHILALDRGGLRGILSLGMLRRVEPSFMRTSCPPA